MKIASRDFGEIDIKDDEIITFVQPPFGFDDYTKYTFIYDEEIGTHIVWLQSVEDPNICFILFDPSSLASFYTPKFDEATLDSLGDGEIVCWVIAVIPSDIKKATLNLKSPIIINTDTNKASQVILDGDYSLRHPLMKEAE